MYKKQDCIREAAKKVHPIGVRPLRGGHKALVDHKWRKFFCGFPKSLNMKWRRGFYTYDLDIHIWDFRVNMSRASFALEKVLFICTHF